MRQRVTTRSTLGQDLNVRVCSSCQPFYTATKDRRQRGRVDKFASATAKPRTLRRAFAAASRSPGRQQSQHAERDARRIGLPSMGLSGEGSSRCSGKTITCGPRRRRRGRNPESAPISRPNRSVLAVVKTEALRFERRGTAGDSLNTCSSTAAFSVAVHRALRDELRTKLIEHFHDGSGTWRSLPSRSSRPWGSKRRWPLDDALLDLRMLGNAPAPARRRAAPRLFFWPARSLNAVLDHESGRFFGELETQLCRSHGDDRDAPIDPARKSARRRARPILVQRVERRHKTRAQFAIRQVVDVEFLEDAVDVPSPAIRPLGG